MDAIKFELLMNLIGIKTKGGGIDAGSITSGTIDPARLPESGMTSLFMYNDASDISTYKKLSSSPSSGGVQTVVVASATGTGVAQAWATEPGSPNKTYIPIGIIHSHVHAKKTGAGNVTLACEIYKRTVGGVETLLFTTDSTPNLTTAETSYNLEQYNDAIVSLNSSDRIVIKYVYTVTSGTPTITIYFEDAYLSRVEMPFSNVTPSTYDASVIVSGVFDPARIYLATDTYANIVTNYPAASYSGYKAWATNGAGYEVKSDGTSWITQLYPNVTTTLSSSSGVVTVDCRSGYSRFSLALTENITSWSFTNLPTTGRYRDIFIEITQHASSAKTVVSPASTNKTAGGAWVASPVLSSVEILGVRVFSDGTKHLFPSGLLG